MCITGCKKTKTYNLDGLTAEYCYEHKTSEMINTRHEKCDECRFQASFGYMDTNLREKCSIHKLNGMINLKHKNIPCIGYMCKSCRTPNHNGYCSEKCYISNNLQDYVYVENSNILYKEYLVFKYLKESYHYNIVCDKIYTCKYRPDFCISMDGFTMLIELDEYQHKSYSKHSENDRIENIYHAVNEPLYIIRFNPDGYITKDGNIKSPFMDNTIINMIDWENRLQSLTDTINTCIAKGAPCTYEIIHLFYDSDK